MPLERVPELLATLDEAIDRHDLGRFRAALHAAAEPCLLLIQGDAGAALAPGASRIGGLPDLPPDVTWPEVDGCKPPFLAQLDLAALPRFEGAPLPDSGWLALFGDGDELVAARYFAADRADLRRVEIDPDEIEQDWAGESVYEVVPIGAATLAVSLNFGQIEEAAELGERDSGRVIDLISALNPSDRYDDRRGVAGQFLGHMNFPGASPGDAVDYGGRKGKDWRNLLEIQSVGSMMWSDCGMLNILVREADLARRNFTNLYAAVYSG